MKAVVQRVRDASVTVDGRIRGSIKKGLLVYLGVGREDTGTDVTYLARKILGLRVFPDAENRMNLSLLDLRAGTNANPGILVISQFTLLADVRKGRRPSYNDAAPPEVARTLYESFLAELAAGGVDPQSGVFQEHMDVAYTNDGPVTILIDSLER